jgi:hypothetical protein
MDFSTATNSALFYSGTGTGDVADALAAEKGLTTISMTPGGSYLQSLNLYAGGFSEAEADQIWASASQQFASGASGDVNAILNNPSPGRTYLSTELPILQNNPSVTSINETTIPGLYVPSGNFH